jgi:hypothetical protein
MRARCVGLLQVSVRRALSHGPVQSALLQALPPQEVLRDRHAQGVHPHRRGEDEEEEEDRGEPVSQDVHRLRRLEQRAVRDNACSDILRTRRINGFFIINYIDERQDFGSWRFKV